MNTNLLKLIITMQLELRTIAQKVSVVERSLQEVIQEVEESKPPALLPAPSITARQTEAYRTANSMKMKMYWKSPAGMARRAKGVKSKVGSNG